MTKNHLYIIVGSKISSPYSLENSRFQEDQQFSESVSNLLSKESAFKQQQTNKQTKFSRWKIGVALSLKSNTRNLHYFKRSICFLTDILKTAMIDN